MAITTLDGVIAGAQPAEHILKAGSVTDTVGVMHSYFYLSGRPGAAAVPTPGLAGAALTTYDGQIPFTNPGAGVNTYLSRFVMTASTAATVLLCDRLWHNSGIVITDAAAQTVNSVAWPARDRDGTTLGQGVIVGIEASTAIGVSAVTNTTMSYTNQSGTAGRTATMTSWPSTATANTFVPFQLAAGDTGVRSIQSLTLGTSYVSGTIHLVAYRLLASVGLLAANVAAEVNAVTGGFPRLYDDTVPWLMIVPSSGASTVTLQGSMHVTQG